MRLWDETPAMLDRAKKVEDNANPMGVVTTAADEEPLLHFYEAEHKITDASVIIFPGGGYMCRAGYEGYGYARFFNSLGMNAFVLDYRANPYRFPIPLLDARRAFRYVRHHAKDFGVDPNRLAVMGSSAGGHLAALLSTYTEPIAYEGIDEIDCEDYLPNFQILCYPVIVSGAPTHEGSYMALTGTSDRTVWASYAPDALVHERTPSAFIWHTSDDGAVNVVNSYAYASALRGKGIKHEMHIFPSGPHGLGVADDQPYVARWLGMLTDHLRLIGYLPE